MGKYGIHHKNAAGKKLLEYATANDLRFATTFFRAGKKSRQLCAPRGGGYNHATYIANGRNHQLDHFLVSAESLKCVIFAQPTGEQLLESDHWNVALKVRVARNLKKPTAKTPPANLNLIGMTREIGANGSPEDVPNADTEKLADEAGRAFANLNLGENATSAQRLEATTKALKEAEKGLPRTEPAPVWFNKAFPHMRDISRQITELHKANNAPGLTQQQKATRRKTIVVLRRKRVNAIAKAEGEYMEWLERQVEVDENNGPSATSGRRAWIRLKQMLHLGKPRGVKYTDGVLLLCDNDGNPTNDPGSVKQIIEGYAINELYKEWEDADPTVVDEIEQGATTQVAVPTRQQVKEALGHIKNNRSRADVGAELWKGLYMVKNKCKDMKKAFEDAIIGQYKAEENNDYTSNVQVKILPKPGKPKSGYMKDKRNITLLPLCTCVLEEFIRTRLEKVYNAYIDQMLMQYGFTKNKGCQEALHVHRMILELRKKCGLDTFILNLDVIKAFDKVNPSILYTLLRKIGAPEHLVKAVEHIFSTRTMNWKGTMAKVSHGEGRTLLMQGGGLGPTIYKILKLGVYLSLDKGPVWGDDQKMQIGNDFSAVLQGANRGKTKGYDPCNNLLNIPPMDVRFLTLLWIVFADDMQVYFGSRARLQQGANAFIKHLVRWGLHVHAAAQQNEKSKSTAMLIPAHNRIEISDDGEIIRCERPAGATEPLAVLDGFIQFIQQYKFLGSIFTRDCKFATEIDNRIHLFLGKLHQCQEQLRSKHATLKFKKQMVRAILDETLFYGVESLVLSPQQIQQYESARLHALRAMRNITRWDQQIRHLSAKRLLADYHMCTAKEKIMRKAFNFAAKILTKAPTSSPERMLFGAPTMHWVDGEHKVELKPHGRHQSYANTFARYLEDRAFQLWYYVKVMGKDVGELDYLYVCKALLRFKGTQREMTFDKTWMDLLSESPEIWDHVVRYGQFEPRNPEETDQERRQKRQNSFAPQVPQDYITGMGGRVRLRQIIYHANN